MEDFSLLGCLSLDMGQATRASNSFSNMWGGQVVQEMSSLLNVKTPLRKETNVMMLWKIVSHCHSNVVQVHKEENMPLNWLG